METPTHNSEAGEPVERRSFLAAAGGALAAGALAPGLLAQASPGHYSLPPLPYAKEALEPAIDAATMEIHHGRHHNTYVVNLNKALADNPDTAKVPLETLLSDLSKVPESIRGVIRNHGGGHHNHALFWTSLKPKGGGEPSGALGDAVKAGFDGFDKFKTAFSDGALKVFGSGWQWLVKKGGKLDLMGTPNQDSPLSQGAVPLLGLDVWEHAYYLNYQNRRADYLAAWWNVVNWNEVNTRFAQA